MAIDAGQRDAASFAARLAGGRATVVAAIVLAFGFVASSGASAQCVGTYHAGSGAGAHGAAASSSGLRSASSATHASTATPSSCAAGGAMANAARFAPLLSTAGLGAGKRGVAAGTHHGVAQTAAAVNVGKTADAKKLGGNAVKP